MLFETLNILVWESESSLFSPDQFAGYAVTAVLTIINVIIAYIIIRLAIYKRIVKMIHKRQEALDAELEAAKKSKEEADKVSRKIYTTLARGEKNFSPPQNKQVKKLPANFKGKISGRIVRACLVEKLTSFSVTEEE